MLPSMRQDRVYRTWISVVKESVAKVTVIVQQGKRNFIHVAFFLNFILLLMIILMSVDLYEK